MDVARIYTSHGIHFADIREAEMIPPVGPGESYTVPSVYLFRHTSISPRDDIPVA
jgi:hypothetical protein